MKRFLGLLLLLASIPCCGQYVTLTGHLQAANGLPARNFGITFTPSQVGFIAGTGVVVNSTTACATSNDGAVVGTPNPLSAPHITTGSTGTLPSGNYFVRIAWFDGSGNNTLVSPESVIQLNSTGRIIVAPPPHGLPAGSVGMRVYVSATANAETLQGSSSGSAAYIQQVGLVAGAAMPSTNATICRQVANDVIWPVGTGYTVALIDSSGNTFPGYPMQWQLMGAGSTINLSAGLPYYNGTVIFPSPIMATPSNRGTQSIAGSLVVGGDLTVEQTNGTINPTANNPLGDLGEQINASVAAHGCATYIIPPGSYSFSHAIHVPQCVSLWGNGEATKLFWTGAGAAIIASSPSAPGQYVQGYLGNFTINGTSAAGQVGVYQGGDPTCTGSCTTNPSTNVGYNYVIRDLIEYNMDNGVQWGNEAFNIEWDNVLWQNNRSYGWYYPAAAGGGGQVSHFYHSSMSGNALGAFLIDQPPQVTFAMFGMDIEYNGSQSAPGVVAMQGGTYTCVDCHIESAFGPYVSVGVNNQTVKFVGGIWVLTAGSTTDPYLVALNGGNGNFSMDGTLLYILHPVTQLVRETTDSPTSTLDVHNLGLYDPAFNLKSMTNKSGAGVSWCMPYDNTNNTGSGSCYDGNTQTAPVMTAASAQNPANFRPAAAYMSWNGDGASGGVDLYNTFNAGSSTTYAFRFNAREGGTDVPIFSILRDGWANAPGYQVNGVVGFTGTKVIGGCTVAINGGIITTVTGC